MIKALRNWLIKKLTGRAIRYEVFGIIIVNSLYFAYLYFRDTNFLTTIIDFLDLDITDKIAILTLSIITISFLYYLGYTMVRGIQVNLKPLDQYTYQYKITFHGIFFCLGIILPLLIFSLLANHQLEVLVFILMNSGLMVFFGWGNEKYVYPLKQTVLVTVIMTDADKTSNDKPREYSELLVTRDTDYIFKSENGDRIVVPIAQVKEIRIHDIIQK